jgi:hypothetical protein
VARISLLLLAAVALFAPLTYSDLPDQTWFGGLWDDGDSDTVVLQLEATGAVIAPLARGSVDPFLVVFDLLHRRGQVANVSAAAGTDRNRAPPAL